MTQIKFNNFTKFAYEYILYFTNIFAIFKQYFISYYTYALNKINILYTNIYDYFFGNLNFALSTPNLFLNVLEQIPKNSKILDFGCGNGVCYDNSKICKLITMNNLQITGIDINSVYINRCKDRIFINNLDANVKIVLADIFTYKFEDKFDYVILSESAPLMSEEFLNNIIQYISSNLLENIGKIIFINNLTDNPQKIVSILKPQLKYFTSIDFGRILDKNEFIKLSEKINKKVKFRIIQKMSIIDISKFFKIYYLYIILRIFGFKNYNVEQYEIYFESKNNVDNII